MSTELLHYCIDQLITRPRALSIRVPIDNIARKSFTHAWSHARFAEQQQSILRLPPDNPLFGRGYLWPYELHWTETPEGNLLRIEYSLLTTASARELILLASISEIGIPFPYSRAIFKVAKTRMLGKETKRAGGAVAPSLRSAVASVQYLCQDGAATISAIRFPDVVDIEP